jgi:predicted ester cyclase
MIADGDRVAVRLTITGVHTGPLQGIPPTGRTVTIGSINFFRFEGGAIAEQWVDYDALGMMQQLGVLSAAPQATA